MFENLLAIVANMIRIQNCQVTLDKRFHPICIRPGSALRDIRVLD